MGKEVFSVEMQVRDYECDMQAIVNNAVYQNYLEYARHAFLRSRGLDFADLTARGVIVVVIRAELDYKQSLKSGDSFRISVQAEKSSRVKLDFVQEINKLDTGELVMRARITATSLNDRNRPYFPEELAALL